MIDSRSARAVDFIRRPPRLIVLGSVVFGCLSFSARPYSSGGLSASVSSPSMTPAFVDPFRCLRSFGLQPPVGASCLFYQVEQRSSSHRSMQCPVSGCLVVRPAIHLSLNNLSMPIVPRRSQDFNKKMSGQRKILKIFTGSPRIYYIGRTNRRFRKNMHP